jgi:hypothetical protein
MMQSRIVTTIAKPAGPLRVKHYTGLPPELTEGKDIREQLPTPVLALIEETQDGIFLKRYDSSGMCVGDTWHQSVDDAKTQASFEYGEAMAGWREVPVNVVDAVSFGLAGAANDDDR